MDPVPVPASAAVSPPDSVPAGKPAIAVAGLKDFGDWMSPMLVKELRQGLKSWFFIIGFLLLHLSLAVLTWIIAESETKDRDLISMFWWGITLIINGVIPFQAFGALHDERRGNTLDMLQLTRLTAWRIAIGKWAAIAGQTILVALTVMPYFIVRHFAGGISLPWELTWFGLYVCLSLVTSAMVIGVSWIPVFLLRGLFSLAAIGLGLLITGATIDECLRRLDYEFDRLPAGEFTLLLSCLAVAAAWLAWFFLDLGATQVAPISENRTTPRRIVNTCLILLMLAGSFLLSNTVPGFREISVVLATYAGLLVILCSIRELAEAGSAVPPIVGPFVKRGRMAMLAGRLLYPGWAAGFLWYLAAMGLTLAVVLWHMQSPRLRIFRYFNLRDVLTLGIVVLALIGTLPSVAGIFHWVRKHRAPRFGAFAGVLLGVGLLQLILFAVSFTRPLRHAHWLGYFSPGMGILSIPHLRQQSFDENFRHLPRGGFHSKEYLDAEARRERAFTSRLTACLCVTAGSTLFWLLFMLIRARRELALYRDMERQLLSGEEENPAADPPAPQPAAV